MDMIMIDNGIKVNKTYIIQHICNIIENALNINALIHYNDVKFALYNNNNIVDYFNNKRNSSVYINNLLKYDRAIKNSLAKKNIILAPDGNYKYSNEILTNLSTASKLTITPPDYFCPYMELITANKQAAKVSTKLSKTNELILNHDLNNSPDMDQFVRYLNNIIKDISIRVHKKSYILLYNNVESILTISDNSIDLKLDVGLKRELNICKKLYPFKFYIYYDISTILYILNYKGFMLDANYVTIKLFDITVDSISRKYFQDNGDSSYQIITNLYDIFYKDKIHSMLFEDYLLVRQFYNIFNNSSRKNYISFIVGQYKLYIYLKNKYNREIKNVALELYDNNNRNVINKIIGFNDTTSYSMDVFNSEIISTEEILI